MNIKNKIIRYLARSRSIGRPVNDSEESKQEQKRNLAILTLSTAASIAALTAFGVYDQLKPRDKYYQIINDQSLLEESALNPDMPFALNDDYTPGMDNANTQRGTNALPKAAIITNTPIKPSALEKKAETKTNSAPVAPAEKNYAPKIREHPVTDKFVNAVVYAESKGDHYAVSKKGARGIMQIMPETWEEITEKLYGKPLSHDRAFDPQTNQKVGTAYLAVINNSLSKNLPTYRELSTIEKQKCVAASYNSGYNRFIRIAKVHGINNSISRMPKETREYVKKVENYLLAKK